MVCPNCYGDLFDGWDCRQCGYSIPVKARKAHGRELTAKESKEVRRKLGIGEESDEKKEE